MGEEVEAFLNRLLLRPTPRNATALPGLLDGEGDG
jgi:hypothetical protein